MTVERMERVNQSLKEEISNILQFELQDPRLEFVSITHVATSRNLQHAKVYFSVLGDEKKARIAQEGLNSATGFIRRIIGKRIRLRYTPEIVFVLDKSIEYSIDIDEKIERIKSESQKSRSDNQQA